MQVTFISECGCPAGIYGSFDSGKLSGQQDILKIAQNKLTNTRVYDTKSRQRNPYDLWCLADTME